MSGEIPVPWERCHPQTLHRPLKVPMNKMKVTHSGLTLEKSLSLISKFVKLFGIDNRKSNL